MPDAVFWPLAIYGCLAVLLVVYRNDLLSLVLHAVHYCECGNPWRECRRPWESW